MRKKRARRRLLGAVSCHDSGACPSSRLGEEDGLRMDGRALIPLAVARDSRLHLRRGRIDRGCNPLHRSTRSLRQRKRAESSYEARRSDRSPPRSCENGSRTLDRTRIPQIHQLSVFPLSPSEMNERRETSRVDGRETKPLPSSLPSRPKTQRAKALLATSRSPPHHSR